MAIACTRKKIAATPLLISSPEDAPGGHPTDGQNQHRRLIDPIADRPVLTYNARFVKAAAIALQPPLPPG